MSVIKFDNVFIFIQNTEAKYLSAEYTVKSKYSDMKRREM